MERPSEHHHLTHSVRITPANPALSDLDLSWKTGVFTAEDGKGPLRSLHEVGDALVAVARFDNEGATVLGSGVMVGSPGLLVTASHVLDEFPQEGSGPVFLTFLPDGARAWLPIDWATLSKPSEFDERRKVVSDISLVSCTLNSETHADLPHMLAPMQIALPLIGERLWAIGFRHQAIEDSAALVTPLISSGLVTAVYPNGRGEHMASPCFEVNIDTVGRMSGRAVVNADGNLVGILSSEAASHCFFSSLRLLQNFRKYRLNGSRNYLKGAKARHIGGRNVILLHQINLICGDRRVGGSNSEANPITRHSAKGNGTRRGSLPASAPIVCNSSRYV